MTLRDFSFKRYRKYVIPTLVLIGAIEGASTVCGASFDKLIEGLAQSSSFIVHMFPPDWMAFSEMLKPAIESIVVAFLGTVFGTVISLIMALLAASNISAKWVRNTTRFFIALERSLPELVILLLLVAAYGLGTMPAIMTLAIGAIGMMGKLLADTIEEIDPITIESMQSVGAKKVQIIMFGVLPQILPSIISFALFRFEVNLRLSVILGAVGAGGIGYELDYAFNTLEYHRAFTALLVILIMVFSTERLSYLLRDKIKVVGALK
jgi:phosphonate transport system permease protein